MKALGRGSIASYLEIALNVVGILLWVALGGLIIGAASYAAFWALVGAGVFDPSEFEGELSVLIGLDGSLSWHLVTAAVLAGFVAIIGGLVIVGRLKSLYASFRSAQYFKKENATHLRVIWITMIAVEVSRYAIQAGAGLVFTAVGAAPKLSVNINLMSWTAILVLIAVSEVFREGARLREEQELTI
jgi:hypothetical protein